MNFRTIQPYDSKRILSSARHDMGWNHLLRFSLCGWLALAPALVAQQKPDSTPAGKSPSDTKAQETDSDAPPTPSSPEQDIEVASYYIHKGDPDAAIPRLEEAIRLKPKLAKPRLMLAEVYEKKGDAAAAVKCYKEYLQVFPSAPDEKKIQKKIEKLTGQ
jgi:tetratricopeptide (TPR) repeat protein